MIELAFALALTGAPQSAKAVDVPPVCVGATFVSCQACADATDEGTPIHSLAMINLGAEAYEQGDYASALRYYDKAEISGQRVSSDVIFHTFRGDTYRHAGRTAAAAEDARRAWMYLIGQPPVGTDPRDLRPIDDDVRFFVLTIILPILKDGDAAVFEQARTMYAGLPLDGSDWAALSNRATVLMDLGDFPAAIADSKRAVDLQPGDAGLQNNHCYVLTMAGQPGAGLPHCERAVALAPDVAPVRHSYAAALAGVGRCEDSGRQLAEARRLDPSGVIYREALACTPK
jgi:tetratricopeptide (TPR) repeat protein